tara:strand:- start:1046 stop:1324 length:279 start_codon:yes stop_codon:yes gene_type:complete
MNNYTKTPSIGINDKGICRYRGSGMLLGPYDSHWCNFNYCSYDNKTIYPKNDISNNVINHVINHDHLEPPLFNVGNCFNLDNLDVSNKIKKL